MLCIIGLPLNQLCPPPTFSSAVCERYTISPLSPASLSFALRTRQCVQFAWPVVSRYDSSAILSVIPSVGHVSSSSFAFRFRFCFSSRRFVPLVHAYSTGSIQISSSNLFRVLDSSEFVAASVHRQARPWFVVSLRLTLDGPKCAPSSEPDPCISNHSLSRAYFLLRIHFKRFNLFAFHNVTDANRKQHVALLL